MKVWNLNLKTDSSWLTDFWLPESASTVSGHTDGLFGFILFLCILFFIVLMGAMIYFVIKYKYRNDSDRTSDVTGNHTLEVLWSVGPGILLMVIFGWGFMDYMKMSAMPAESIKIRAYAQKWSWTFTYPESGVTSSRLVVPMGKAVELTMSSKDVIHSFYVPGFRIKKDVLPNRYTLLWFEPTVEGEFDVFCAEYCGTSHSEMITKVKVVPEAEYEKWILDGGDLGGANMPPAELGAKVFEQKGCGACHTTDGTAKIGPSLKGLYGSSKTFESGESVPADDNYIRESINVPAAKVVKGFPPVMPSFQGQINDKQMDALIEYIKTLK